MSKNTQLGNLVNGIYVDSTGKVGVGTQSPLYPHEVVKDITYSDNIVNGDAQFSVAGATTRTKRMTFGYDTNSTNGFGYIKTGNQGVAYTPLYLNPSSAGAGGVAIGYAPSAATPPNSGLLVQGNVGIGTDSPNVSGQGGGINVLTVKGSSSWGGLEVSNNSSTAGGLLLGFYGFTNSLLGAGYKMPSYIGCWLESGGSSSGGSLRFFTQSNGTATAAERMRITHDGNIAIGNTSPSTRLHVTGTISANDLTLTGSSSWSYTTNGSWTSHQQVVPFGALSGGGVYLIRLQWGGGASPYIAYGSLLWMPVQSNGGGTDPEVLVLSSTHQGGAGFFYARNIATYGQASSGLTIRLANFADPSGGITVTAIKLT